MHEIERRRILGAPVDYVDMPGCLQCIDKLINNPGMGHYILAVNPEKVFALRKNPFLRRLFENAALLIPDGIGVVLSLRWLHGFKAKRVAGADLMLNLCEQAAKKGYRIFVYGSREEVNNKAVDILRSRYPGILIVGRANGYIPEENMDELIDDINDSKADILLVALGSPRQEIWISRHLPKVKVKVCQGIGGTLDTLTNHTRRAPKLFQKSGLEWFYRLIREPKRMTRQMVLPVFAFKIMEEKFRKGNG